MSNRVPLVRHAIGHMYCTNCWKANYNLTATTTTNGSYSIVGSVQLPAKGLVTSILRTHGYHYCIKVVEKKRQPTKIRAAKHTRARLAYPVYGRRSFDRTGRTVISAVREVHSCLTVALDEMAQPKCGEDCNEPLPHLVPLPLPCLFLCCCIEFISHCGSGCVVQPCRNAHVSTFLCCLKWYRFVTLGALACKAFPPSMSQQIGRAKSYTR